MEQGRKRAVSAVTELFGHYLAQLPEPVGLTWAVCLVKISSDPGGDYVKNTVWNRSIQFSRMRSRLVVHRRGGGYFEEFSEEEMIRFRENNYLWSECLTDGNATDEDIDALASEVTTWKFNPHLPLWRAQYVRKMKDGSACLIFTTNHAIGDGMSLVEMLLNLCDNPSQSSSSQIQKRDKVKRKKEGIFTLIGKQLHHSKKKKEKGFDSPSALSPIGPISTKTFVARGKPISLVEINQVRTKIKDATVNDVLMALLTATVRSFLLEAGEDIYDPNKLIRGGFPVSVRKRNEPVFRDGDPHNKVAYGSFRFDFDYKTRLELIHKVKRQIDEIKSNAAPFLQYRYLQILLKVLPPRIIVKKTLDRTRKFTAQLSNVVGPQKQIQFAGIPVEDLSFYLFGPVGLYFGIFSYNGNLNVTVNMNESIKADPKNLARHWNAEFDALKKEVEELE